MESWAEHFNGVLNRSSSVKEDAIDRHPQIEFDALRDEFPTVMETRKAVQKMLPGKTPGADAIPAEVHMDGGYPWQRNMAGLVHILWRKEAIPQVFKNAIIIHLYKWKGNPQVCDNNRGTSLLGRYLKQFC